MVASGGAATPHPGATAASSNQVLDSRHVAAPNRHTAASEQHTAKQNADSNQDTQPKDLASLLNELGLSKYLKVFDEQDVDLPMFLTLTESDLKEVGIK